MQQLKIYKNIFIKSLFVDNKIIDSFNLTDSFYKTFVRRNRKLGFELFMLRDLRNLVNSILECLRELNGLIINALMIGYMDYNNIYISVMTKQKISIKKQHYYNGAIVKNIVDSDNSLLLQINVRTVNKECILY